MDANHTSLHQIQVFYSQVLCTVGSWVYKLQQIIHCSV